LFQALGQIITNCFDHVFRDIPVFLPLEPVENLFKVVHLFVIPFLLDVEGAEIGHLELGLIEEDTAFFTIFVHGLVALGTNHSII
jgi:hypothetical protein